MKRRLRLLGYIFVLLLVIFGGVLSIHNYYKKKPIKSLNIHPQLMATSKYKEVKIKSTKVGTSYSTFSRKAHKQLRSIPFTSKSRKIISDEEFTRQDITIEKFLKFFKYFKYNRFTTIEKHFIYNNAVKNRLNPFVLLLKIELESGLVSNAGRYSEKTYRHRMRWILGYGMYKSIITKNGIYKPNGGFLKQVSRGARCLRYWMNNYTAGISYNIINLGKYKLIPNNACSYALYQYTPFWGRFEENNTACAGNEIFAPKYYKWKKLWETIK